MSAAFVRWTCYFSIVPGTIIKTMPLNLLYGVEPPEHKGYDGIPCTRVIVNAEKKLVAYAGMNATTDIRTAVELIQQVEGL